MADHGLIAQRKATAVLLRRALDGNLSSDEVQWPGSDADESVQIAITAVSEYLEREVGSDSTDQEYWDGELSRMAMALESGDPLGSDQLRGWKGIDLTRVVVGVVGVAAGGLIWFLFEYLLRDAIVAAWFGVALPVLSLLAGILIVTTLWPGRDD